jgi:hypothetical protein
MVIHDRYRESLPPHAVRYHDFHNLLCRVGGPKAIQLDIQWVTFRPLDVGGRAIDFVEYV